MNQVEMQEKQQFYIQKVQSGERDLIPELWELLRPLTNKFINKYLFSWKGTRHYEYDDLLDLSYIALCAALDGYNSRKGAFSAYYFLHIQRATAELRGTRKRHDVNRDTVSLNISLLEDEEVELLDALEDDAATETLAEIERRVYLEQLKAAFAKSDRYLTDQERQVIHACFYEQKTRREVCQRLGLSDWQIRNIAASAMNKYLQPHEDVDLRMFTDYSRPRSISTEQPFTGSSMDRFMEEQTNREKRAAREAEILKSTKYVSYGRARAYIEGLTDTY